MILKGFCLLTLSFIISTFQESNAFRDGKLTVVNVYSGLQSVAGGGHPPPADVGPPPPADVGPPPPADVGPPPPPADVVPPVPAHHDDKVHSFSDEDEFDEDDESDEEDEEMEEESDDDPEYDRKVSYGNPKVLSSHARKPEVKPVAHNNKKKKKHGSHHKKAFYNAMTEDPVTVAPHEKTTKGFPLLSTKNMNWNNFKKIVETLKMKKH